ncbi:hypothetical protein AYI69_g363 [Smittium culicis]|uniref:Uncharacterized protein n=1 Tax=Smittium culicis TaxID=133412 RepID=A0A1R1X697_9FUNG|nr:hypothetical protein AYI69_g10376 [Smittium culicis]OMJ30103.1 hypothetical protein AYI69_g363 [Smittium culicis]
MNNEVAVTLNDQKTNNDNSIHGNQFDKSNISCENIYTAIIDAGSVVFLSSNVPHCSCENESSSFRFCYMPQFSRSPILKSTQNGLNNLDPDNLVAFAVEY